MSENPTTSNGHQAAPIELAFGDLPNQVLSLAWAEGMLRELFATDRARFGRILATVATGERQAAPGRKPAGGQS